jgi:hypothetical protein
MVTLAQSSPSCRSASALQSKTATVMLGAIFFEREMSFARDSGKKFKKDHPHPQFGEENYSLANLKTAGKMYRQLLKDKQT